MKKILNLSASLLTAVALLLPMTGCEHTHNSAHGTMKQRNIGAFARKKAVPIPLP